MNYDNYLRLSCVVLLSLLLGACSGGGGGNTGSNVSEAVLLEGDPASPAVNATKDLLAGGAQNSDIDNGIILTRVIMYLTPGATVDQINAAITQVGGRIVTMLAGTPALTIEIPRPQDVNAATLVVNALRKMPGIAWANIGHVASPQVLPVGDARSVSNRKQLAYLLPTRFPAAWNASFLATKGCESRKVPVLVEDYFDINWTNSHTEFNREVPNFSVTGSRLSDKHHGYDVTTTMAAMFDSSNPTGANPYSNCLQVNAIDISNTDELSRISTVINRFPAEKFILNSSLGTIDPARCDVTGCTASQFLAFQNLSSPYARAYNTALWTKSTAPRWNDFLVSVSAGNSRKDEIAIIYPGMGIASAMSYISTATLNDPIAFMSNPLLWNATSAYPDFPSLVPSSEEFNTLRVFREALLLDTYGAANNVLMAGSTKPDTRAESSLESDFSNSNADVYAMGEDVYMFTKDKNGSNYQQGTSFTAPQVAGLASYLWLLSPELRSLPSPVTRQAIIDNTTLSASGLKIIDAYASALSLDDAALPTPASAPIRLAILDVNNDGFFNELDVSEYVFSYTDGATGKPLEPLDPDYGRYDLNGDGYSGGTRTAKFDLDRVGSTQFGKADYNTVQQLIGAEQVTFKETAVTDIQVLCYYANSSMYTGDTGARDQLLAGKCNSKKPQIVAGSLSSCMVLVDGTVICWGYNFDISTPVFASIPVAIDGISNAKGVAVGFAHACALLENGTISCWGSNYIGELGNGSTSSAVIATPVQVSGISTAKLISANAQRTCAVLANGTVRCWGANNIGELGNGDTKHSSIPVEVIGISDAIAVTVGESHACALRSNGHVQCWGYGLYGELGNGNFSNSSIPVNVTGITTATEISADGNHTCALLTEGTIRCWGAGSDGQLGNGSTEITNNANTPVAVKNISNATAITAGGYHSCAVLPDGSMRCWGYGYHGELGNNIADFSGIPVVVEGISTAIQATAGKSHTCVINANDQVFCWGLGDSGQLGNGKASTSLIPVEVSAPLSVPNT